MDIIDGSWADMLTLLVGVAAVFVRPIRRKLSKKPSCFDRSNCIIDFLNGATVFPFMMLFLSAFSSFVLKEVMNAKISLGLAGFVGFIFVVGEVLRAE